MAEKKSKKVLTPDKAEYRAGWPWINETLSSGQTISRITQPSNDTCTRIKHEAPFIDNLVRRAAAIICQVDDISVDQLRREVPDLSLRASDKRLVMLIDAINADGNLPGSVREFTNDLIADAAKGYKLSAETVAWYRSHPSRQTKSTKRGRPRKS